MQLIERFIQIIFLLKMPLFSPKRSLNPITKGKRNRSSNRKLEKLHFTPFCTTFQIPDPKDFWKQFFTCAQYFPGLESHYPNPDSEYSRPLSGFVLLSFTLFFAPQTFVSTCFQHKLVLKVPMTMREEMGFNQSILLIINLKNQQRT